MTVKTTILEIAHGALGASYLDAIKAMYQQAVEDGVFETVEMEYATGIDAFCFKIHTHRGIQLLQHSNCGNTVQYITGKTSDRLCNDQINFARPTICNHAVKVISMFQRCA